MRSLRRLRRRDLQWQRYAHHTYWSPRHTRPAWMSTDTEMTAGHIRAWTALQNELERRQCRPAPRDLDDRCCGLDEGHGHTGPHAWFCSQCTGTGDCWACDGDGEDGSGLPDTCTECGGSGRCTAGCDDGWYSEDDIGPVGEWRDGRRVETLTAAGGVL